MEPEEVQHLRSGRGRDAGEDAVRGRELLGHQVETREWISKRKE